ncbi:hypothetical protein [Neisseria sp.]|uniref:hypothetical protein n=1 Tax=Neisseria sp. TaxID=192066 RepID=UPI0035A08192
MIITAKGLRQENRYDRDNLGMLQRAQGEGNPEEEQFIDSIDASGWPETPPNILFNAAGNYFRWNQTNRTTAQQAEEEIEDIIPGLPINPADYRFNAADNTYRRIKPQGSAAGDDYDTYHNADTLYPYRLIPAESLSRHGLRTAAGRFGKCGKKA